MTPTENDRTPSARGGRTAGPRAVTGVVIAVATSFVALATVSDDAAAAATTKSEVVANQADDALDALERWNETQNPVDYIHFAHARDEAAATAEVEVELLPGALQQAWSGVSITNQEALLNAISQLGVPYRSLASEPDVAFDCSGLTIWAFAEAGIEIPRVSGDQIRAADDVDRDAAEAGDLVYYPGHISMYLGADVMVHSPNSGSHVEIVHLPTSKSLRFGDATPNEVAAEVIEPGSRSESVAPADIFH